MSAEDLLTWLQARGVQLETVGDKLRWRPRKAVPAELQAALAQHKPELLALLRAEASLEAKPVAGLSGVDRSASCATTPSLAAGPRASQCSGLLDARPAAGTFPQPVSTWDCAMSELISWFQAALNRLPREPFALHPWVRVDAPATFYTALQQDIAAGPRGARARTGALGTDLRRLWELYHASN
jgi:hypothetical protein